MQNQEMLSKAIRYQKAASDNAFNIISAIQKSGEQMLKTTLDQYSWIPEKGKKDYLSWSQNYLQITEKMKAYIDKGYEEAERLFVLPDKKVQPAMNVQEQKEAPVPQKKTPTPAEAPKQSGKTQPAGEAQEKAPK
jgi:hypothetical protein